ncbi:MAG: hypothetical protein IKZ49_01880 [Alphaproteobacteria bacterium]|nr:hypothetical protein [Alphaproteobacteria bacterium]
MDYQTAKKVHSSKDYREFNQDPTFLFVNQFMKKGKDFDAELQKQFLQVINCAITKKNVDENCQEVYDWVKNNNLLDIIIEFIHSNRDKAIWYPDEEEVQRHIQELNSLSLFFQSFNPTNSINRAIFDKIQNVDSITKLKKVITDVVKISKDTVYKMYFDTQTTRIIEDIFNRHDTVTPTLIDEKGVDFFINKIPLDLKITCFPKEYLKLQRKELKLKNEITKLKAIAKKYNINFDKTAKEDILKHLITSKIKDINNQEALQQLQNLDKENLSIINSTKVNKHNIIKWLYENQGAMRFCAENRLFLVLYDSKQPEMSDKMRITHYQDIKNAINGYLDTFKEENLQDIEFVFNKETYTTKSDIIFVVI